jgi:hypothetical protein
MLWAIFTPIYGIFKIWVGNPVFTVLELFNEKYRQMAEAAQHYIEKF